MEFINGPMVASTKAIGFRTRSQVMVNIPGMTREPIRDTGKKTTCMVKESTNGQMVENMKEIT